MNILAVDPGGTTGWASYTLAGGFRSGQVRNWLDWLRQVECWPQQDGWEFVVEKYTITPETLRKTRQYDALEIIGAMRYLAHRYGAKFTLQTPADAKSFATDRKLHAMEWWVRGQGHANDAARHLMIYCVREYPGIVLPKLEEGL